MPYLDGTGLLLRVWCVGVGGTALGLSCLLLEKYAGWRYVRVAAALGGLAFCVGAAVLSVADFWVPLAALGGMSLVAWAAYSAQFWHAARRIAKPRLIWLALLIGSPLYATYAVTKLAEPPDSLEWVHSVVLRRDEIPGIRIVTDRGRKLKLYRFVVTDEAAEAERHWVAEGRLECHIIRTGEVDPSSNCHGWVFTGGRYAIHPDDVESILEDNGYQPVASPSKGDLIVYRNEAGVVMHTGIVLEVVHENLVLIESKWGPLGRFLHPPEYQPYGANYSYYHSSREGHQMPIVETTDQDGR